MSGPDEFAEYVKAKTLAAFGLHEWDITAKVRPPWRVRLWRAVTFAEKRGKVIDWAPYERAEEEVRASNEAFKAALPGRMNSVADSLSEMLPEGLRFEWSTPSAAAVSVAEEMGIHPAAPMTGEQYAEFARRMEGRRFGWTEEQ